MSIERIRLGAFTLESSEIDAFAPCDINYVCTILGVRSLEQLVNRGWIDLSRTKVILNDQPSTVGAIVDIPGVTRVNWRDEADQVSLARHIVEVRSLLGDALHGLSNDGAILIDATALPKTILAAIVGLLIRTKVVHRIDVIYQRQEYFLKQRPLEEAYEDQAVFRQVNDISFSLSAIPYVEGIYDPALRRHFVLMTGWDYGRVIARIKDLEPASIDLIVEQEAIGSEGGSEKLRQIYRRFDVEDGRVIQVPRSGVIGVIEGLRDIVQRGLSKGLQTVFVSGGGKPHLIAATLQSVLESDKPLFTSIPDRVVPIRTEPIGKLMLFRLTDSTTIK